MVLVEHICCGQCWKYGRLGDSSSLYTAIGKEIAIATESGKVTTFSLDGLKHGAGRKER